MGLAHAGFGGGRAETLGASYSAGVSATATTVTAGGSTNTYGSWQSLGTANFDYNWVVLTVSQAAASSKIFNIGINDGSGNWFIIAEDVHFPGLRNADEIFHYSLPLYVPAGAEVGCQVRASSASAVINLTLTGFSRGPMNMPGYSRMLRISTIGTNSRGTTVDPGATANTKGTWAELSASSPASFDALYGIIGYATDISRTATATALFDIGVGANPNECACIENLYLRWTTTLDGPAVVTGVMPIPVREGVRVVARAACSDTVAGDRAFDLSLYGFVP